MRYPAPTEVEAVRLVEGLTDFVARAGMYGRFSLVLAIKRLEEDFRLLANGDPTETKMIQDGIAFLKNQLETRE